MKVYKNFTKLFLCLSIVAIVSIFSASCSDQGGTVSSPPAGNTGTSNGDRTAAPAPTPDLMATGRKLYVDNCAICHKVSGKGGKIEIEGRSISPDDLTSDKIKKMADDRIYGYVFNGIPDEGMPAFKEKLSEAEIREVVRYIRAELQK